MFLGLNDVGFLGAVSAPALDPDAAAYIAAVEAADTQALEQGVRDAINDFVVGCKADGIWNAIKASCILAGARTLSGALVPLVGAAPTNVDGLFVSDDYDRKTGLVGDGSTKLLNANRNNNVDPQNDKHISAYLTEAGSIISGNFQAYISGHDATSGSEIARSGASPANLVFGINSALVALSGAAGVTGLYGASRSSSTSFISRVGGVNATLSSNSGTPVNVSVRVFRRASTTGSLGHSNARLAFYSIGESLDLALLDARVTALINAFDAAL
jgi:hypothetical protein